MQAINGNNHQPSSSPSWTRDPSMYSWASEGGQTQAVSRTIPTENPAGEKTPAQEHQSPIPAAGESQPDAGITPGSDRVADVDDTTAPRRTAPVERQTGSQSSPGTGAEPPVSSPSGPAEVRAVASAVTAAPGLGGQQQAFRPAWEEPTGVLDSAIRERRSRPTLGWRHLAYELTGGRWNPGLSAAESRLREQMRRIKTPLPGPHSVLVSSIKGGVGKTTVSAVLGLALAEYQGKHVIAMDANPDAGTLGDRLVGPTQAGKITVRNLLDNLADIRSATDLSGYTHLAGRLHVLTSEQLPEPGEMFSAADYEAALRLVSLYFQAIVTDSGTGIMHSAMQGALHHADSLVIVAAPTIDAASRAESTFQWLVSHGYQHLTEDAVVVMSYDRHSPDVDDEKVTNVFRERCRAVVKLPPDPHLQAGGIIDFDALTPATRDAVLELAAVVAEGFQGRTTRGLANHRFRALPDTGGPR